MKQIETFEIISIVTPSYNQGEFLDRTLNSILTQSGPFYIDMVVMDGGSKDNSVSIITDYANLIHSGELSGEYNGLSFRTLKNQGNKNTNCLGISYRWVSEKDNGQTHAINKGWKLAVGSIIAWLNSDDVYHSNALEKAYKTLKDKKEIGLYGIGLHIDKEDRLMEFYPIEPYSFERLVDYCIICQPTVFLKSDVLESVGFLNEKLGYCMDYEYWLRIGKRNDFHFLPEVLACTRIHENTKTSQNLKVHSEIIQMQKKVVGKTSKHWLFHFANYSLADKFPRWKGKFPLKVMTRIYSLILGFLYR
ncbi:glycosyltransferase [Leptospira congkakensis]|uniref:Glycosyltransferase n=1 Tax=Leptospira congkakensis TaxID=2484932 RepID=A0A4Z1ACE4_9LEPT|nr:glycosyltransferase family 2 protein [Leptospira congkakensis]TGL90244.1 glycosyltransferase [Leptospira congkakensis]TGL91250.1 glycosyltransferase [Leptospira congkakensis]TGL98303.1 glycosyltransferase [Leptospira congkakensis]